MEIAKREIEPQLQKLKDEGKQIYSISKANTIDQCMYQAYMTYIKHLKSRQSVYGICGTKVHDTLEAIMKGEKTVTDLEPAIDSEMETLDLLGISFPKDRLGRDSIRDNWLANMRHFARHFTKPVGKFKEEVFVLYPLSEDRYVQGYIDLIRVLDEEKKIVEVYDWKTSSQFSEEDLLHHGRQLVFYSLALEKMGYTVRKAAWIMLKYVTVTFMGKSKVNSKTKIEQVKVLERRKIAEGLTRYFRWDLEELGYDEFQIEDMIQGSLLENKIPDPLMSRYKVRPYVRNYPITDDLKQECVDYLNNAADKFESADPDNEDDWKPMIIDRGSEFFCSVLCGHGDKCKYLREYYDRKTAVDDMFDLF